MKRFKQMLAGILLASFIATMGIMPTVASAEETTEETQVVMTAEDALLVEKLEALGVIKTLPETLNVPVTRRDMAELICHYIKMPVSNTGITAAPFVDVSLYDSALGAITALYKAKLITGDGVYFYPDQNINYDDVIVMIINALGYKLMAVREGGYPTGYHRIAIKLGMLKDLDVQSGRAEITLRDAFKLLEAGLAADAVEVNYLEGDDANYIISKTDDFLSSVYNITTHQGIITGSEDSSLSNGQTNYSDEQIEIDFVMYDTPGYIYATSLGRSVTYYLRSDGSGGVEIAYIEEDDRLNKVTKIEADDLLKDETTATRVYFTDDNNKEKHINFVSAPYVLYNGRTWKDYGTLKNALPTAGYIEGLDNNGDDTCDVLFVYEYDNMMAGTVDAYAYTVTDKHTATKLNLDPSDNDVRYYLPAENKPLNGIDKLKTNDILTVMKSKDKEPLITIYVSRKVVSGTVTEISEDLGVCIDGEYYKQAVDCAGETITVGMLADFYLDFTGKIAAAEYGSAVNENEKYAVLSGVEVDTSSRINTDMMIRLYTQDGSHEIVKVADKLRIGDKRYNVKESKEDRDAVLDLLYKQGHGEGKIVDAYVVRYVITEGELTYLDIGNTGKDGKLNIIGNDSIIQLLPRKTASVLRLQLDKTPTFAYAKFDKTKLLVFVAPTDASKTEDYAILKELEEKQYQPASGPYLAYTASSAVYSLNTTETNFAEVVLLRGTSSAAMLDQNTSTLYIYEKMTSALNEEGTVTKKLHFGKGTKLLAEKVEKFKVGSTEYTTAEKINEQLAALKPGSVVQCGLNADGDVNQISLLAAPAADGTVEFKYTRDKRFGEGGANQVLGGGIVEAVDTENGTMSVNLKDQAGDTTQVVILTAGVKPQVYRSATEEFTSDGIESLAKGDYVLFTVADYLKATSIVAIK